MLLVKFFFWQLKVIDNFSNFIKLFLSYLPRVVNFIISPSSLFLIVVAWKIWNSWNSTIGEKSVTARIPDRNFHRSRFEGGKCLIKALKISFIRRIDTVRMFIRLHWWWWCWWYGASVIMRCLGCSAVVF